MYVPQLMSTLNKLVKHKFHTCFVESQNPLTFDRESVRANYGPLLEPTAKCNG